jgi:hypothetical protein
MKTKILLFATFFTIAISSFSQVDTSYVYNPNAPYGSLDIRLAKSPTRYYYLQEDVTFSFRESAPGVKTNTFFDMTSWNSSAYTQGNLREKNGSADNFVMNYRLLKPVGYNPSYEKGYPLIVMFHGSGEHGNCWNGNCYHANKDYNPLINNPAAPTAPDHELLNNDHQLTHGGRTYLDAVNLAGNKLPDDPTLSERAFPGFILFPQNLNGWGANPAQDAIRIVRLISKKYNIDEDRIYINGLSNGGYGVYEVMKRAPWMVAAAITMSAVNDGSITNRNLESTISNIPHWIFQGALDTNPNPSRTRRYVKSFRDAGAIIKYTEYEDLGHTTWNRAYKDPGFFKWMLGENKSGVHIFAGNAGLCNSSGAGLPLELPEGFLAYQWEMNGQIISGANSSIYTATSSGKYRARFSRVANPAEADWNNWSPEVEIAIQNPPAAEIKQVGTAMLADLNNNNMARLEAVGEFAHYYWYKDGVLLDLPGAEDDTIRFINIQSGTCSGACPGNGAYTLVVSNYDNCNSTPSTARNIFFNNQAPMIIAAATEFKAQNVSASGLTLSWKDNSQDETGFEIWRRKKISGSQFSPWEMITSTASSATTFNEVNLEPSTTYQYKIRAVSNAARSEYTPAAADVLEVLTTGDTEVPGTPINLEAKRTSIDTYLLTWSPVTDNTGVREYRIAVGSDTVFTNSADTTYQLTDLEVNGYYTVDVAAIDLAGNKGSASNRVSITTVVTGLFYEHSPGYWPSLDSIDFSKPEYTGFVDNFTLSPKTQDDYFYMRFDGFLYITTPGNYQFRLTSNDGSRLRLNETLIVDNDGLHDLVTVESGVQTLAEGAQRITVDFFDYTAADSLIVEYKGPDSNNSWSVIPAEALKSGLIVSNEPDQHQPFTVSVYPNPTNQSNIQVQVESKYPDPVDVLLYDAMGRKIYSRQFDAAQSRAGVQLSPNQFLKQGVYIIRVNQGDYFKQQKIIIQN